jgi:hypothetical protein
MRRLLDIASAEDGETEVSEERVSVLVDSVGEAGRQLGAIAAVVAAARLASLLLGH